ncbi:MAG TPA: GntR family transcriptional regulator [Actinopolymorphaceae bacterium]
MEDRDGKGTVAPSIWLPFLAAEIGPDPARRVTAGEGRHMHTRNALADHLLEEIVSGRLPTGTRLPPERTLASEFGLSRPIVREVLRSLAERGLVEIQPSRGTFVREPNVVACAPSLDAAYRRRNTTVREVLEARLTLEPYAAALAARKATEEDLSALAVCLDTQRTGDGDHEIGDLARSETAFGSRVIGAAHNGVLETMHASLAGLFLELTVRCLSDPQVRRSGYPTQYAAFEAIRDRHPERAGRALRHRIDMMRRVLADDLDRSVNAL